MRIINKENETKTHRHKGGQVFKLVYNVKSQIDVNKPLHNQAA